ncbi:MAG TPA: FtsX-like permease family protein, partial [Bryobacteraceae bacterium]|nr:FtsX-like permease family protein [Bryobacteraceae bacterium]
AAQVDLQDAMKAAGATQSGSRGAMRLRQALVVIELVTSVTLLLGTALLARSFLKLSSVPLGFEPTKLITLRFNLRGRPYASSSAQINYYRDVLARIKQLSAVRSASVASDVPLDEAQPWSELRFQIGGRPPAPLAEQPRANTKLVSAGYFGTLGIPLKRGRLFSPFDTPGASHPVIVNEALVRQVFAHEGPIGKQIVFGHPGNAPWTIIGVVGTVRGSHLAAEPPALIYDCLCQSQSPFLTELALFVRTKSNPHQAIHDVEAQIFSVDHSQPLSDVRTMEERLAISLAPQRFHLTLIGFFAGIALILSALGTYGVLSYLVARRRREIGIRLAIGAQPPHIVGMIVRESCVLIAVSLFIGLSISWAFRHYLQSLLYGIPTSDAVSFVAAPLTLAVTALIASAVPARQAARMDPITTLRDE